jgi:ribonuclease HI/pterin-4a-carbinolamine dehydratase
MWQETKKGLYRKFEFRDFKEAFLFMTKVSVIAEKLNHHPTWTNTYNRVEIWLSTHDSGDSVTDQDRNMSSQIDDIVNRTIAPASKEYANDFENTPLSGEVVMYADGGSRGNPGPSALGFAILDKDQNVIQSGSEYLGITTNNQAEYQALREGLKACHKLGARVVHVRMDSLLVINQMKGIYKVKNRDLWPVYQEIKNSLQLFDKVGFDHVPRELNKLADSKVNEELDRTKNSST